MIDLHVDLEASIAVAMAVPLKIDADLDRYRSAIEATKPEVIVETGTYRGESARWFAGLGLDVVTVDIVARVEWWSDETITPIIGDSAEPMTAVAAAGFVAGRRCMVSLDSSHRTEHVAAEIRLYGPLVSPGCYLVVEDGIARWLPWEDDGPLGAIEVELVDSDEWERDTDIETMHPVSMFPGGWWRRVA